jgi:HK97 gp10 family phage protein
MAVGTSKILRGNQGGHAGFVTATIDERELNSLIKDLEKLNMSDSKNKTLLRQGMRKAAKPILQELKSIVPVESKQLKKSLAVINGKNVKGKPPTVYVGPRVKKSFASKEKSGFYFYFLEYGFRGIPGLRMLDKAASSKGNTAINSVIGEIRKLIDKRMK